MTTPTLTPRPSRSIHIVTTPETPRPISADHPRTRLRCGDIDVLYVLDSATGAVGLRMLPTSHAHREIEPRRHHVGPESAHLPANWLPVPASRGEASLVQIKLAEDAQGNAFTGGRSMRQNPTVDGLRFRRQDLEQPEPGGWRVVTELGDERGLRCLHILRFEAGDEAVTVHTEVQNNGTSPLTLEMLSSFCLGHLTPFHAADAPERLWVHRFRSCWASEGRPERVRVEDLHLERSWGTFGVTSERFGQVGSMPVRGWFPFVAIEDDAEGVFWAAQIHAPGSWQLEVFRRGDDRISLSGGLADREFGHWTKTLSPWEHFITPPALLTTVSGDLDRACQRLTSLHAKALETTPERDRDLPIIFNEWCSSWGWPTPEFILRTADLLPELGVEIFVIDDGWSAKPAGGFQFNGDWDVALDRFPAGLAPICRTLRERGLVPGLWFEFEVCTEGTLAWDRTEHHLHRDGRVLQVGPRRYWDFTDPWTHDYLAEKVIGRLRNDGFGYLKIDYNDTIGLGCDHPDGLGEGLRLHLEGVQTFLRRIRRDLPDLIIEICSAGGHRLEPSFLSLGAMGSFSDAHEPVDLPIIAANLHRLILPRQNQVWAVLHAGDSLQRLHYSIASCFLGRACLSGDIAGLSPDQFAHVRSLLALYRRITPIIRDGRSHVHRNLGASYRHPRGWQAVIRRTADEALVVFHAFGACAGRNISIATSEFSGWQGAEVLGVNASLSIHPQGLVFATQADFTAVVAHLKRPA